MRTMDDLYFFSVLARQPSLSAAAEALGVTPPAVSRRLAQLEARLGVSLLHRSTRNLSLTSEGAFYLEEGDRILGALEGLENSLAAPQEVPRGALRINATLGFGRRYLASVVADFSQCYPEVEVFLQLTDKPLDFAQHGVDMGIRFGEPPDARVVARKIANNRRLLCAAPAYLESMGWPQVPGDLRKHQCIALRENGLTNNWQLFDGQEQINVKIHGRLSTNHGELAVDWALRGLGIILRSEWDVGALLRSGRLCQVLPQWIGHAGDIHAVYPEKLRAAPKIRAFVDFLVARFSDQRLG